MQLNSKWYYYNEFQERHYVAPFAQHQALIRGHLHRILGQTGWEASGGMCLFLQNPNDPRAKVKLTIPELRPHLEAIYRQRFTKLSLEHRYRFEERFFHNTNNTITALEEGYDFGNYHMRYRFQAAVPLFKTHNQSVLKAKISDEIHLNAGKNIVANTFDQNRIYAVLTYELSPKLSFDAGYLNWFQQRPNGNYFNRHILLFAASHKIDLSKKTKPAAPALNR